MTSRHDTSSFRFGAYKDVNTSRPCFNFALHNSNEVGETTEAGLLFHPHRPKVAQEPLVGHGASPSHSDTPHSAELLLTSDQPDAETSIWWHTTLNNIHGPGRIQTRNPGKWKPTDPCLRPCSYWDQHRNLLVCYVKWYFTGVASQKVCKWVTRTSNRYYYVEKLKKVVLDMVNVHVNLLYVLYS